jgi:hypothetical protein
MALKESSVLIRSLYDKEHAFLGLKKINELIPAEQYLWFEEASKNMNETGINYATDALIKILEFYVQNADPEVKRFLDLELFAWLKEKLKTQLF